MREFITAVSANSEESVSCEGVADEIKSHTNSAGEKRTLNAKKDSELESTQVEQISTIESIVEESPLEKIWNGQGASFGKEQKVLVCDDEPDILDLLQEIVGLLGVTVIAANNAVEALKLLESESVDVIISDLKMPMMDGIEFIEEVRKTNLNVPVIFCSAFADRRELIKFMDLGAYGFIDKPFESERVEWMVRSALALKIMRDGVVKLSKLNFNAYINMVKILTIVEGDNINTKDLKALQIKLGEKLGDISSITNSLLKMRKH
ncbi:MAG: response regulator [Bdellovibrionota bacterium]